MNKKTLSFLVIAIILTISTPAIFAQDATIPESDLPQIVYIEGLVSVNIEGDKWESAQKGTVLNEASMIETFDQAYCDIAFDSELKNIVSIGPNTALSIGEHLAKVKISQGRVFSKMSGLSAGSQFEVVTPHAIAGVRGTEWETIVDKTVKFNVNENTIYVKGVGEAGEVTSESDVPEGQSIMVDDSGWLGELVALTDQDKDRLEKWSNRIKDALELSANKRKCNDILNNYQGGTPNLFEEVLSCDANANEGSFAAAGGSGGLLLGREGDQGIADDDLTLNTFTDLPQPPVEEPPVEEPPDLRYCCPNPGICEICD